MYIDAFILALISFIIGVIPLFLVKRNFLILMIAAAAYFSAIFSKTIIQLFFLNFFQTPQLLTYLVYGLLTAITEPGFAYLFVRYTNKHPQTYGVSLAFWENGVLVGLIPMLESVFLPNENLPMLMLIAVKIMDRSSSLLVHYSWGVCAYLSYWKKDIKYLLSVAPLGFVDSLTAYVHLTHGNLFTASLPTLILGIVGFLVTRHYLRKSAY
ncbi:hypothetical protein [Sulfurisphaera ohwakuensis]|uniref:Energy-converting hydrogenase Eha subunit E n=1 Tax=Sulfurisphaera ohwakuensis TaxID=69656 RepID=A0A650CF11_SULOH|nr:hypothetical protein [Sulfurisphaera ohwakuensis]MBB5254411.1 energy-converting hydrogenase Eha subunit E [Sulfurisphaera ohwakuensis]QGR16338.1 hypothetical protein D1869_03320 [Sulfurisphaera ohwakuensis]